MKSTSQLLLLSLLCAVFSFSCEDDDDSPSSGGPSGGSVSFHSTVNGENVEADADFIIGQQFDLPAYSILNATGVRFTPTDTINVTIIIQADSPDGFVVGHEYTSEGDYYGEYCKGTVTYEGTNTVHLAYSDDQSDVVAKCTPTAINESAETWSGTFSFSAYDDDDDVTYEVMSGEFENVPYSY